jgi:hypothetical protein
MKSILPICLLAAGLAACSRPAASPPPEPAGAPAPASAEGAAQTPAAQTPAGSTPAGPAPAASAPSVRTASRLPPPDSEYRYVGRWAAAETACGHEAWTFTPAAMTSPTGETCDFEGVSRTAAGYEVEAACLAKGARTPARITLRFAESAKALLASGGPFGKGAGLVWCGAG